jgi:urea transport system permease protein
MEAALTLVLDTANYVLVIALVATGLVVIFSLMNVINLAHGELFLLGAYTLLLAERAGLGFWAGLLLAPLVLGIVGLLIEELVIRHIYHRFLDAILVTWGCRSRSSRP